MADDSKKMRNCLICTVPINECHLGIDSCRACSVFYKRTIKLNQEWLKCKKGTNDCIEIKPTTSCRKCRFRKFSDVLAQSANREDDESDGTDTESEVEKQSQPSTSFLDHDSFSLLPSPPSNTPLLDRIKNGYSLVCVIRKTGEINYIPPGFAPTREQMESNDMDFFQAKYSLILPLAKVLMTAIFDFGNATFADFRDLNIMDKCTALIASFKLMVMLDCSYRSVQYFPDCDTRCAGYMFTVSDAGVDAYLEDCPNDINREEVAAAFRQNAKKLTKMKEQMKRLAPTDREFAMLFGLLFWSNEVSALCESLTPVVEKNRKAIMDELHLMYKQQGKGDYAARIGELYCMMANIEEISTLVEADMELYKLMNVYTEFGSTQ